MKIIIVLLLAAIACFAVAMAAWAGEIVRDPAQVRAFRATHPCPATGKTTGACKGWVVDHKIPLCAGGQDSPDNMQWQDKRAGLQKDKLEWWICRRAKQCLPAGIGH